jgi:hypothetical protein
VQLRQVLDLLAPDHGQALPHELPERHAGTVYAIAQSTTVEIDARTGRPEAFGPEQRAFLEPRPGACS